MDFSIWFLLGAVLVFFMQGGFAMVETGFTRSKNAGNIIMKNLMDFCIGTVMFVLLGFGLMMAEDYAFGLIGIPNLAIFTDYKTFDYSSFVFNLVFCATAATIVSGSMAERTKFSSYCIYSAVISAVIYPIEAGWVWNSRGWLAQMGYVDFAGSTVIHMVGGVTALVGAWMLGPRIGKYVRNKKTGRLEAKAIPGHSITLGALGVFILWFAWYGFNGAAATDIGQLGSILLTTTVAPAVATCTTMLFTWIKNGKPDVSMSLNGSLAGLVAITASCHCTDALGSAVIGMVAGVLVVVIVEFLDIKCHIDDPVGAVAVHGANGLWGGIAVGLFSTESGLLYGHGFHQLGVQLLGIAAILIWTIITMTIVFKIIKATNGLRVSAEDEISGLDLPEHGLVSAYADFMPTVPSVTVESLSAANVSGSVPEEDAVPVEIRPVPGSAKTAAKGVDPASDGSQISKVEILLKQERFEALKDAMMDIGITGMTVSHVLGCGAQKGKPEYYRGVKQDITLLPKVQVDIVVCKVPVRTVIEAAKKALYTGHIGDGKIFVYAVGNAVKIRTGEEGYDALQDVE